MALYGFGPNGAPLESKLTGIEEAKELEQDIRAVDAELSRVGGR
jgi:hypothetical protein